MHLRFCRTFQRAHDVMAVGGEIDALDPAGYGTVTITKAISISGHGFAGLSVNSGNGITISAGANDKINVRGLLIDGAGSGGNGIKFVTGASLTVQDCLIRSFPISISLTGNGVACVPSASSKLSISNTVIWDNGAEGVLVEPALAGATIRITRSTITGNLVGFATSIIDSFGDNALRGNTTNGTPTNTVALQ